MMNDDELNNSSIDELITYNEIQNNTPEYPPVIEEDYDFEPDTPAGRDVTEYDDDLNITYEDSSGDDDYFDDLDDDDGGKSKIKTIIIIAVILAIITGIMFVLSMDNEIVNTYKRNFANNFAKITSVFTMETVDTSVENDTQNNDYNVNVRSSVIVSDGVRGAEVLQYKEGIVCASQNHLSYIDSSGNILWKVDTLISKPLIAVRGGYILIAEKGGSKLCLYNDGKLLYEADDPDTIAAVRISSSGDSVLITNKPPYRGGISVYNKIGEQIFSWASGSGAVISADISPTSRNVAVSLLDTSESAKSIIQFFNIKETQSYAQVNAEDTVMFDLCFNGDTLTAFGDNRLTVLSDKGGVISDNMMTDYQLTHSAMDDNGNKVLILYDNSFPKLNLYGKKGNEQASTVIDGMADSVDIIDNTVIYNVGRDIYCGRPGSDDLTKYTAAMDIQKLILISQRTFAIVYSNSIEIVKV